MKTHNVVAALAALAQDNRLDVFRLLVQAGPDGMPAGRVAEELGLAPNTLTFHFDRLRLAGWSRCVGRSFNDPCCSLRDYDRPARLPP